MDHGSVGELLARHESKRWCAGITTGYCFGGQQEENGLVVNFISLKNFNVLLHIIKKGSVTLSMKSMLIMNDSHIYTYCYL
jgi:hypothetical protein